MGVDLPEAEPVLFLARPTDPWGDRGWSGPVSFGNQDISDGLKWAPLSATPDSIVSKLENSDLAALYTSCENIPALRASDPNMEGYSWYPRRVACRLVQKITMRDGEVMEEGTRQWSEEAQSIPGDRTKFPDDITLELTISSPGKDDEVMSFPTYIAINTDHNGWDGINGGWFPKRGRDVKKLIDADLLRTLFFNYYNDGESCDSYDTQLEDFDQEAEKRLHEVFLSEKKAILWAAEQAVNDWNVTSSLRALGKKRVTLEIRDNKIKIIREKENPETDQSNGKSSKTRKKAS